MEEQFQPARNNDLNSLSVKELLLKYTRFIPWFIFSVIVGLLGAFLYLRYATPIYRSIGTLVINNDNNTNRGNVDKFQQLFSSNTKDIASEIEELRSRPLMEKVVDTLNLNFTYLLKGKIKDENRYKSAAFTIQPLQIADSNNSFSLKITLADNRFRIDDEGNWYAFGQVFKNQYGSFKLIKNDADNINGEYNVSWQPTISVAYNLISDLTVVPKNPTTGILIITLEAPHPKLAADVINQLMREYQLSTIEDKNETTQQTIVFIDGRLKLISKELDSITGRLLNYQKANNLINADAQSSQYFTNSTEAERTIYETGGQLKIAQSIEAYLRDRRNNFSTTPSTLTINDPTLNTLIALYNTTQLERKRLIDANTPSTNPLVVQREEQIERLRQNILENLRIIQIEYEAAIGRSQQRSSSLQTKINALPEKEQGLIDIKRQQDAKQAIYNFLNERREESAISLAATISNIKVLDKALPNGLPVKPNRKSIQLIALIAGLAVPALIIFIIEVLNDKINNRSDIEKLTTVPIIGEIGHSLLKDVLAVKPNSRGVLGEQFRIIRSNLQFVLTNLQKPVILVTSSFSGEGKSFISTNFGAVMSLANKKTIVLEFDIRKPKILSQLHIAKKPGLTNYLLGKVTVEELPVKVEGYDNLYVLACGPVPPNPAELLLEPKLNDLFAYLKQQFDVIIIDTAPVGMVSDALTLSRFADATLYIMRQKYTYKKQVGLVDELYREGKLTKISIVLNDVKLQAGYGYGYGGYGRYGYSYGYGSGYFEDEAPPGFFQRWFGWLSPGKKQN